MSININDLRIDTRSLGEQKLLIDVLPIAEYKDGERTSMVSGYKYVIALPAHKLEKISVKIDGPQKMQPSQDGYKNVEFTDLEIRAYVIDGKPVLSCKAKDIKEVK